MASSATLAELARVLARPKLRRVLAEDEAKLFFDAYSKHVLPIVVAAAPGLSRDTDDDAFLHLAISGRADWLVTGDRDLLVLGSIEVTRIVTPAGFLDAIDAPATPKT